MIWLSAVNFQSITVTRFAHETFPGEKLSSTTTTTKGDEALQSVVLLEEDEKTGRD